MFRLLAGWFRLVRQKTDRGEHPHGGSGKPATAPALCRGHVLLTRRSRDPAWQVPGFDEVYRCTPCGDYFVLAWHPVGSGPASDMDAVAAEVLPPGSTNLEELCVFCPACRRPHVHYGRVLWAGQHRRLMQVLDWFSLVYAPREVGAVPRRSLGFGDQQARELVVFLGGEVPAGGDRHASVHEFLRNLFRDAAFKPPPSLQVDVVCVDAISDESVAVLAALHNSVCRDVTNSPRICITSPVVRMATVEAMACLVLP